MFKESTDPQLMNTHKMSYFSDIDLATLHRSRLNERIQYKLSWFNRRQKYYIPPTGNQASHRDTTMHPNKTYTNHKFANSLSEQSASNVVHETRSNDQIQTKNRPRKNLCSAKKQTSFNGSIRNVNHCDNATGEETKGHSNKITILNRTSKINGSSEQLTLTNHRMNENEKNQSLASTNTYVSSVSVALASGDADAQQSNAKHCAGPENCLSADLINKKTQDIPFRCNEATPVERAAIEEDLELPHRKRSGTWP